MINFQHIKEGQEHLVQQIAPSPEAIKAMINDAYSTIRGSGSVVTELHNLKDACVDLPTGVASNALKACAQLATVQPINATCTIAKGMKDACVNTAKLAAAPVAGGIAATEQALKTAGNVAMLPVKAPIRAFQTVKRGGLKLLHTLDSGVSTTTAGSAPSANDTAQPPMAAAA